MKDQDWDLINKVHTYGAYKVSLAIVKFVLFARVLTVIFLFSAQERHGLTSGNRSMVVSSTLLRQPVSSATSARRTTLVSCLSLETMSLKLINRKPPSSARSVSLRPLRRRVPSTTSLPTLSLPSVCLIEGSYILFLVSDFNSCQPHDRYNHAS
jgi:hypothetical protein